jgi:hypothetical protein
MGQMHGGPGDVTPIVQAGSFVDCCRHPGVGATAGALPESHVVRYHRGRRLLSSAELLRRHLIIGC